jgi:cellulose synthase/poly-beta-1,6-N-acetylglucosamine synthase-like glycosyltransferase
MDESLIRAVNFENINEYYRKNYIIFYDNNNKLSAGICNVTTKNYIKNKYGNDIKFYPIEQKNLVPILERSFSKPNTKKAQDYLADSAPVSAKNIDWARMIGGFVIMFTTSLLFFPNLFNFINNIVYLAQNIFKEFLFKRSADKEQTAEFYMGGKKFQDKLPIYTIFIPLYKEVRKLKAIIKAMEELNYPKSKLDVKFILEADDRETNKALALIDLPKYIHIIKVPFSLPRTKPKAMNYASAYAKGEYLCVYDAEDRPDPDQLLKALQAFMIMPKEYVCMQARLGFYNPNENILTKFFAIEYSLWFEYLLKGLGLYDLPLTLGGTSNHFKMQALKDVGYWDSYNVTEDADLGIRLYSKGYKVHIIDSETLEEAPISLGNWMSQRTRWIKGFIQTFYVFLMQQKNYKELGIVKIFSVYIFIGFSSYSFICMPWLIMVFLLSLNKYMYYLWFINSVFSLAYMYSSVYYITRQKKSMAINSLIIIIWPLYFVLHSIASYIAIFELFTSPFRWNKTQHGMSVSEID